MSRTTRGFQKITGGFKWTRSGFVKLPDRLKTVTIKKPSLAAKGATAIKIKPRKGKAQPKTRLGVRVHRMAVETSAENSAPTLAPEPQKLTAPQRRPTWAGKYADLAPPQPAD